jgi:hypothetical protein
MCDEGFEHNITGVTYRQYKKHLQFGIILDLRKINS